MGARDLELGQVAAVRLAAAGGDVRFLELDVTSDHSVAAATARVAEEAPLDVLINNAGILEPRLAPLDTKPEEFLACFGVNLLGPVRVTRAFVPPMEGSAHPRIVMVSSGMGSVTVTSDPERGESGLVALVYPSSKAALNMITTQYAKAPPAFRVNAMDRATRRPT